MQGGSRRWRMRCANLTEAGKAQGFHAFAFFNLTATEHEQDRNRPPDCKTEIAAAIAVANGDQIGKATSNSSYKEYQIEALAARFPIIATHVGFDGLEVLA